MDQSNHALAALRYLITRLDKTRLGGACPVEPPTPIDPEKEAARRRWERLHEDPGPGSDWVALW